MVQILAAFLVFSGSIVAVPLLPKTSCRWAGSKRVEYDERCIRDANLLGCNANAQGVACRFCGFSIYPACPGPNEAEDIGIHRYSGLDYVEGDILLINKTASEYYKTFLDSNTRIKQLLENQQDANSQVFRNAIADRRKIWDNGVVPFTISLSFDQDERNVILKAMRTIEDSTCITFVPRTNENDYIRFARGGGCFSYIGRSGGAQPISLGYGCLYVGIAMHEMMHALGFYHEQSRADRDGYVIIRWENIQQGMEGNFNKYTLAEIDHLGESYDYSSIMHYTATAFSYDGIQPTIIPREPDVKLIHSAQKTVPSRTDLVKINKLYLCEDQLITTRKPTTTTASTTVQPTTADPTCVDRNELCAGWATHSHCTDNVEYMKVACQKSCNYCNAGKLPECDDFHPYCREWELAGECDKVVDYMRYVCPQACKYCNPQCEAFRDSLQAASRLQRLASDSRQVPRPPPIPNKNAKKWPQ